MEEPLEGAICDSNDQYWYQNDQWKILQRLVEVSKQDRKYFWKFLMKDDFSNKGEISKNGFWPKTGSIYGLVSRPQRGAVESFTDHFDTNNDSGSSIFCLSAQKIALLYPHMPVCT